MSQIKIFVEGGGDSEELQARCREGFTKLLANSGFKGRLPRIVACGGRYAAYDAFQSAHKQGKLAYVALLVDSEEPVSDIEKPWEHLKTFTVHGNWERPAGARDDQVFLMTTCMETWIVADRTALKRLYSDCLQESALPDLTNLEQRNRHSVKDALVHATRECKNTYAKNKRSFEALANVEPGILRENLPSFARMLRILHQKL